MRQITQAARALSVKQTRYGRREAGLRERVIIACDSFKGSLSAAQAADALSVGLRATAPEISVREMPIADGGEGTIDALLRAGYHEVPTKATGPTGELVETRFAYLGETAVIELADICGLLRLPGQLAPLTSSTFGFGQVIGNALDAGFRKIILAIGGSASTDGGAGMATALGVEILDQNAHPIAGTGERLIEARDIKMSGAHPALVQTEFRVATDVENPLLGPAGAVAVYSAQKGATQREKLRLESGLRNWADLVEKKFSSPGLRGAPGAGAAGGVGFGAMAFLNASTHSGVQLLLELLNFEEAVDDATLVITGEGTLDHQTLRGKAVHGVSAAASKHGIAAIAVCGINKLTPAQVVDLGLERVFALDEIEPDLKRSQERAHELLIELGKRVGLYLRKSRTSSTKTGNS